MEVLQLKIADQSHIQGILDIYTPIIENTHISFEYQVPTLEEMTQRINKTLEFYPWIIAKIGNQLAGYAYASRFRGRKAYDWVCEVSVYVHPDLYGRGIGKKLYFTTFEILKKQRMTQCIAGISLPNQGSIAFHENCGFKPIGIFSKIGFKKGSWYDVGFWQIEFSDRKDAGGTIAWHQIDKNELRSLGILID